MADDKGNQDIMALKYPLATEKATGTINRTNTITYVVDSRASKGTIAKQFEERFGVKVDSIRIANMPNNTKKAFIKIAKGYNAGEVAMKLKLV
jgi:large subunit ribosomal protein L23